MPNITLAERIQFTIRILNDAAYLRWFMQDWPRQFREDYANHVLQPARNLLKNYDPNLHSDEENKELIDSLVKINNDFENVENVQLNNHQLSRLFHPQDWNPDTFILWLYHHSRRHQNKHSLSVIFSYRPDIFIDHTFEQFLGCLLPNDPRRNLTTFSYILQNERFSWAANFISMYPESAFSENELRKRKIVGESVIKTSKEMYSLMEVFINKHLFNKGFIDEYTYDLSRLANLCDPLTHTLAATTHHGSWVIILDEQAHKLSQLIFDKIMDPVFFKETFSDAPVERIIRFLAELENRHFKHTTKKHIHGLYYQKNDELIASFIIRIIDNITTPSFMEKLSAYPKESCTFEEERILNKIQDMAVQKRHIAKLRMSTTIMLQGKRQPDNIWSNVPKDLIRHIAKMSATDNLEEKTMTNAIQQAEDLTIQIKPSIDAVQHSEIKWMIDGFKQYKQRIDSGESKSDPEAKFRNFKFPFGVSMRAKNRKINYEIALFVTKQLEDLLKLKREIKRDDIEMIFQHFHRSGIYLSYTNTDFLMNKTSSHTIRSDQLNQHIKAILTYLDSTPTHHPTHKPDIKK